MVRDVGLISIITALRFTWHSQRCETGKADLLTKLKECLFF